MVSLKSSQNEPCAMNVPIVATSIYTPPGEAMNKSTPTPASANLLAVFLQAGFSVVNSFRSASVPWILGSSRTDNCPGPHVGRLAVAQTTFPPVAWSAERAAFNAGSTTGSGVLMCEKMEGIRCKRDVMTDLGAIVRYLPESRSTRVLTLIRMDPRTDPR